MQPLKHLQQLLVVIVMIVIAQPELHAEWVRHCETVTEPVCEDVEYTYLNSYERCETQYSWVGNDEDGWFEEYESCEWVEEWVTETRYECHNVTREKCWDIWVPDPDPASISVTIDPTVTSTIAFGGSITYVSTASVTGSIAITKHDLDWQAPGGGWVSSVPGSGGPGTAALGALTGTDSRSLAVSMAQNSTRSIIMSPTQSGTYAVRFSAQDDQGGTWYSPVHNVVVSGPINNAAFVSQDVPSTLQVGETATVSVTMRNNGSTTWGNNHSLGSQHPQDNAIWGTGRVSVGGTPVQPGETKTFTFNITAPSTSGDYNFQWRMVQDGVEWFGASSTNAIIQVTPLPDFEPPTAPGNLSVFNTTKDTISITWTASTDNVGVTEYQIFCNGGEVGSTSSTSYTITGLAPSTVYSIAVYAKDAAGNSSNSSNILDVITRSTGVVLTAIPFYLPKNNYLYDYIQSGGEGVDDMCITLVGDMPDTLSAGMLQAGASLQNAYQIQGEKQSEVIMGFIGRMWWDLQYQDPSVVEELYGHLKHRLEQTFAGDGGTVVAYKVYYDYVEIYEGEGLQAVELGIDGCMVTLSGSEMIIPEPPQFINPETGNDEGCVVIPSMENIIYVMDTSVPSSGEGEGEEGEGGYNNGWNEEMSPGTYYYPYGTTVTVRAQFYEDSQGYHFPSGVTSEWKHTFVAEGGPPPMPEEITSLTIEASVANNEIKVESGGSLAVYLQHPVKITSVATAGGWLSQHSIKGYTSGTVPFAIEHGTQPLPGTAMTGTSRHIVSWTPTETGTYTIYAEAFTGTAPNDRQHGVSGWPGYEGGPFGGLADKRITCNVRNNPTGSVEVLDANHNPLTLENGVFTLVYGETFYVRINGADLDGDASVYHTHIYRIFSGDSARDTGDGYAGSKTFGPFKANVQGEFWVGGRVADATAHSLPGPVTWNESRYGWYSSPQYTVKVTPPFFNAEFVSQSVPLEMRPNTKAEVLVTMRNTGNQPWIEDPTTNTLHSLRAATQYQESTWLLRGVTIGGTPVPPGGEKTFRLAITAGRGPGNHDFQWRMRMNLWTIQGDDWFGEFSPLVSIKIDPNAPLIPPRAPTELAVSDLTSTEATITWAAPLVDVIGYEFLRNGVVFGTTTDTSAKFTGLFPSTTYAITVRALSSNGTFSEPSAPLSITTLASSNTPPVSPQDWAAQHGLNPYDPLGSASNDGLNNIAKYNLGADPNSSHVGSSQTGNTIPAIMEQAGIALQTDASGAYVPGSTAGEFAVDKDGSATYSIPIAVTPGTAGMQPSISLEYNSASGPGIAGFGWSLAGLSSIVRGGQSELVDGQRHALDFTYADRYYFDGQRLVALVAGQDGYNDTEYRLESDNFTRVVSYGSAGQGPGWFKAWTKSGLIIELGNTSDSAHRIGEYDEILAWQVNKISDTAGNYMTFEYDRDYSSGQQFVTKIHYTGNTNGGVAPYASVQFEYEDRPDVKSGYVKGAKVTSKKRLAAIRVFHGWDMVRKYTLTYVQRDYNDRSILASVLESDGDGRAYKPITFEYSDPPYEWEEMPANKRPPAMLGDPTQLPQGVAFIDLDGDGRVDCVQKIKRKSPYPIFGRAWLNKAGGWIEANGDNGAPDFRLPDRCPLFDQNKELPDTGTRFADFNCDGLIDVISLDGGVFLNTGSSFVFSNRYSLPDTPPNPPISETKRQRIDVMDLNGDGRPDIVSTLYYKNYKDHYPALVDTWINTGEGMDDIRGSALQFTTDFVIPGHKYFPSSDTNGVRHIDINGDGLVDIVRNCIVNTVLEKYAWINTGSSFVSVPDYAPPHWMGVHNALLTPDFSNSIGAEFVDLNGDGLPDYIFRYSCKGSSGQSTGMNYVYINTGAGWVKGPDSHLAPAELADLGNNGNGDLLYFIQRACSFIDINNDGLPDFVSSDDNIEDQSMSSKVMINTGTSWVPAPSSMNLPYLLVTGSTYNTGATLNDFNDDGAIDQIWRWNNGTGSNSYKGAMSNKRINPDRLVKATNSLGVSVHITYATLTERDPNTDEPVVYEKGAGTVPPRVDVMMPMHVVKTVAHDDGCGGTYNMDYRYSGLRVEPKRGLLGFEKMQVTDMRTGIKTETFFSQDYQTAGMVTRIVTTAPNGTPQGVVLNESVNQFGCSAYGPDNKVYFPYVAASYQITNDLTGAEISTVTTSYAFDSYGNATSVFVDTSDATGTYAKTTTSTFKNWVTTPSATSLNCWLLGRLTRSTVTTEAPNVPTQTRTSAFKYHSDTGLLTEETIEPDENPSPDPNTMDPTLMLTTTYEYDVFGNKTKATITGNNLGAPRVVETTYDSNGRFPIQTKNALNQTETYTYDQALGVIATTTGPNGITTKWQYDGFARPVKEIRAHGTVFKTETTTAYLWSTTSAAPGSSYLIKTQSSGSAPAITFYDYMGRSIAKWVVTPGGLDRQPRVSITETAYDEFGRAWATSVPHYFNEYVTWAKTAYDILGRPVAVATPDEDAPNREVISTIEYDGLVTRAINPLGQVEESTKNTQGQVVKRINNATGSGVERAEIHYSYDAYGSLLKTAVHREGGAPVETTFTYDNRGRKTSMSDPDMGTWSYQYNALGELTKQTDAKGQITEMTYDALGRMTQRTDADGTVTTWTYDTAANGTGKLASLLVTATGAANYSESFTYDTVGRLTTHTRTIDGENYTTGQEYDQYSRPSVMIYHGGFRVKNHYDALGFLKEVRANGGTIAPSGLYRDVLPNQLFWQADSYTVAGAIDGSTYGNGLTYDAIVSPISGRTKAVVAGVCEAAGGHYAINYAYLHDALGQVTHRMDYVAGREERFAYDGLNRLVAHTMNNNPATTVSYDALGNITGKSDVGNYYYASGRPHAVTQAGAKNYAYDANGNQTSGADRTVEWSSANHVRKITKGNLSTTFRFGAARERIVQEHSNGTSNGTKTVYAGSAYEVVTHSDGLKEERFHIFTPLGRTATRTVYNDGRIETRYYHQDGLGSIIAVSDEYGKVEKHFAYDPWGNRLSLIDLRTASGGEITRGFTDHEHLDDFGLIHMNGRLFDPLLARFLSADPFVGDGSNAQAYNRYSYVENNPLNATDPSGYFSLKEVLPTIIAVVVTVVVIYCSYGTLAPSAIGFWGAVGAGAAGGFSGAFSSVMINGGSFNDAFSAGLKGAAIGALTAAATFGIATGFNELANGTGIWADATVNWTGRTLANASIGGVSSKLQGGEFRHGFYASLATSLMSPRIQQASGKNWYAGLVMSMVVGGTAAEIGGGKFSNGALTGAFQYVFNNVPTEEQLKPSNIASGIGIAGKEIIDFFIGKDYGATWRAMLTEKWVDGPTGGKLPQSLADGLRGVGGNVPGNAAANGMHAWHAGSNAHLANRLGLIGAPFIILGGIFHESPLDWSSFCAEQRYQGTVNHALDSATDIVANIFGLGVGYLMGSQGIDAAIKWGNYIPGPGEPDPAFGGVGGPYKGKPSAAWGQYP